MDPFLSRCPNIVGAAVDASVEAYWSQYPCSCPGEDGVQRQRLMPRYRMEIVDRDDDVPCRAAVEFRSPTPIATYAPNETVEERKAEAKRFRKCDGCNLCVGKRVIVVWIPRDEYETNCACKRLPYENPLTEPAITNVKK
jgi:hypothetical protein